ncbi:efflux RND transporter periplasmic adaptor subunit [Ochrobactrum vermis]|uniref:Efflux RND transporter periplasmic adaptor subunit n=1 Tax=Ochrobactrum vermis TaxID=1827297 RepID=A0ABU8PCQ5_9HYPH|nr:efflux RND transporter periplasmic adaptor subunit [Ochrobactrum vermis]PQZ30418.1 efflux transporter periplasmic adaptor subunit [Ochrobactrum vermis]
MKTAIQFPAIRSMGYLALLGAAVVLSACGKEEEKQTDADVVRPVLYMVVEPKPVTQTGFAGTIEPRYSTDLAFRVLGRIINRPVQVGDLVKKDEMVAMVDPSNLDLAVQSAKADLASAEAQFANASASEERQRILLKGNNVSQADYDAARQARDSAEAGLEKARAGLKKAQDQRSYAVLRPDYDGVISATDAEVGQVVAAGQTVMTVARPDIREAVLDIPDSMTQYFVQGTSFNVQLQADPTVTGQGTVREVAPQADAQTRTRRVRIALENPPEGFRLGATIRAAMAAPEQNLVTMPIQALLDENGKTSIWIIDPHKQTVSLHDVQVTERHGNSFVAGGVDIGSYVAIAGVNELKEGQQVRLNEKGTGL